MMGDFAQALTVFDAALRRGADVALIRARVDGAHTTGIRIARRALGHATGLSESVGESWSRAQIIEAGLPVPTLQCRYRGSSTYFCDFDWDGVLVGEFDGMTKYSRLLRPGQTIADAVAREKAREDELRALGLMVLRWTWSTLVRGELVELLTPWLLRLGITGT
ncbi:hypothetical protein GCM10027169_25210 [Gordonia jinhuaensis]|uniref:Transcriptional regulator, AbiEi antitoxin, Type IV TA system n=1 Tax=Gordonia jinhuaensis TaxID=1517702 RepID=A0A916TC72_9ACTN|nr:hypothetical protein [Gordonia jinhuaensis]GGB39363.1 hypothetical protein GCM10011489_28810 [Gordonia jinhuaensis]